MAPAAIVDVEKLVQRVARLSPDKQKTIAIVLENLENGDDDAFLEQEIVEFQAISRPLDQGENMRLLEKISGV
jgi:hypothetical protein